MTHQQPAPVPRRVLVVDNAAPDPQRSAGERAMVDLMAALHDLGVAVRFHSASSTDTSIGEVLDDWQPDAAIVSRPGPGAVALPALLARPLVMRVYWGHDIHARRLAAQERTLSSAPTTGERVAVLSERECWRHYDVAAYPTHREADLVGAAVGGHGIACPYYSLDTADLPPMAGWTSRRAGVLMVGSASHAPNRDAVQWTVDEILPRLRRDDPDIDVTVVGDWPAEQVRMLEQPGVRFVGRVDDDSLRALHDASLCLLAPLRFGSGSRRKVVAAMGLGLPVVTTSEGQQGVLIRDGAGLADGLTVADDPEHIAAAVRLLSRDQQAWTTRAGAARTAVERVYSAATYRSGVRAVLREASAARAGRMSGVRPQENLTNKEPS